MTKILDSRLRGNDKIAIFKGKKIRKTIYHKEWWFSILDVIGVLTDSPQPKTYWAKMKERDKDMSQPFPFWEQLKLMADDGKYYKTDCADIESIFRIIQSIPSPKAEPFKRWLVKVGYERIQEIENPELATKRTKMLYKLKGYPDDWVEKRMRGIAVREELTDEWQKRGMDDFELILTMLGERTTAEIHRTKDTRGVPRLKDDARVGGQIAGSARKQIERRIGRPIVSKNNFLQNKKRKTLNG